MRERKKTAIVGAGASGLAMARALRELGNNDVVLLEAASSAGGKCSTMHYGGRTYELGAAIVTPAYTRVRQIMAEHDVQWKLRASAHFFEPHRSRLSPRMWVPPRLSWRDAKRFPGDALQVFMSHIREQLAHFPRLDEIPSDWYQPFELWARQHDVESVLEMLRPWATSFGYGFMDQVPAAYMMNYLCVMGPSFELHDTGFGGLWQRVAAGYDVRTNTCVQKVTRSKSGVTIETNRGQFEADEIVITCPLENAAKFLDTNDEERSLFSEVQYMDYQVIAANTRGMPKPAYVFVGDNFTPDRAGKPMFYFRRYPDSGVTTFYSYRGEGGLDGAEREVISLVEGLGGKVTEILARHHHRYFPHVSSVGFGRGFYPRMEALQGKNRTFYAGEVMAFSCVEPVVAYAQQLAERMVGAAGIEPHHLPWPGVANDVWRRLTRRSA